MRTILVVAFLTGTICLFAQRNTVNDKMPGYDIGLTTITGNVFKGLLMQVKDTSLLLYPGNFKEWKANKKFKPVEIGYHNIQEIKLKRKNSTSDTESDNRSSGKKRKTKFHINANEPAFNKFKKTIQ